MKNGTTIENIKKAIIDPGGFTHIGIAVKDIDRARDNYSSLFGIESWTSFEYAAAPETLFFGEAFSIRVSGARMGRITIELIQPVENRRSVWWQYLDRFGEGLHHLAYRVQDFDETVSQVKDRGGRMLLSVSPAEGMHWCYMTISNGGMVLEILNFDLEF